jgi:hypothetical protein
MESAQYDCTVDGTSREEWSDILLTFRDAFIYQSWSYGVVRWGERCLSHLVLKREGEIVAAVQVRLVRIPVLGRGMAYVFRGPMWRRRGNADDPEVYSQIFRALRNEYAVRRGLFLRVLSCEEDDGDEMLKTRVAGEGFRWFETSYRTLMMDLAHSAEDLRNSMRNTWRQSLAKAERGNLEIEEGTSAELFEECLAVYGEMHARKGFAEFVDMEEYGEIQKDLPGNLKMQIMVCREEGTPVAALAWSVIGETCMPILAATGNRGTHLNASHLLFWNMILTLKDSGCRALNLGGINRARNPGGYTWKTGLSGKLGREVGLIGQFDACDRAVSMWLVRMGDGVIALRKRLKRRKGLRIARRLAGLWAGRKGSR